MNLQNLKPHVEKFLGLEQAIHNTQARIAKFDLELRLLEHDAKARQDPHCKAERAHEDIINRIAVLVDNKMGVAHDQEKEDRDLVADIRALKFGLIQNETALQTFRRERDTAKTELLSAFKSMQLEIISAKLAECKDQFDAMDATVALTPVAKHIDGRIDALSAYPAGLPLWNMQFNAGPSTLDPERLFVDLCTEVMRVSEVA